ncbi:MAG: hypothetical protein IAE85_08210 [Anaerolinea sp.]|nr:hypothetical protein [Anaerolinea sp.]
MRGDSGDWFFLALVLVMSCWMVYIGTRNYRSPDEHTPASPLGKYLSQLGRRRNDQHEPDDEQHHDARLVKQEAALFIGGGVLMISVILVTTLVLML